MENSHVGDSLGESQGELSTERLGLTGILPLAELFMEFSALNLVTFLFSKPEFSDKNFAQKMMKNYLR